STRASGRDETSHAAPEARPGSAGACPSVGGLGAISGPPGRKMSTPVTAEVLTVSPPATSRRRARGWWRRVARLADSTPATVGAALILIWVVVAALAP